MKGSKKLAQAIAQNSIVIKNVCAGELSILVGNRSHILSSGETLNISALIDNPEEAARMGRLHDLLRTKKAILV